MWQLICLIKTSLGATWPEFSLGGGPLALPLNRPCRAPTIAEQWTYRCGLNFISVFYPACAYSHSGDLAGYIWSTVVLQQKCDNATLIIFISTTTTTTTTTTYAVKFAEWQHFVIGRGLRFTVFGATCFFVSTTDIWWTDFHYTNVGAKWVPARSRACEFDYTSDVLQHFYNFSNTADVDSVSDRFSRFVDCCTWSFQNIHK